MPKVVRWAGFVLLMWFAMLPQQLKAGEMDHCYFDADAALRIAKDIEYGFPLDSHRACNPKFCTDEEKIAEFGEWWDRLKAAVKHEWDNLPDAPDRAALAAQRVLEACAYEHGKNRKKYLHKTQGEHFRHPDMIQERVCQAEARKAANLYGMVKEVGDADKFLAMYPPEKEGVDPVLARKLVEEIIADNAPSKWLSRWYGRCIGREV